MIKHLFKMVWNRKRTNFLITVEIFFSFLVLFTVILFGVYYTDNYRQPLGFSYQNVLNISITRERRPNILPGSALNVTNDVSGASKPQFWRAIWEP